MRFITTAVPVILFILCANVRADSLAELPYAWQHRLVPVQQIDTSPLKEDEQKAFTETRAKIETLLLSGNADANQLAAEYGRLGNLHLIHELHTSADACYTNAMRLAPEYFPWAYYSAYLAQQEGDMEAALQRFQHAIKLDPSYLPAKYRLAEVYLDLRRLDEAADLFSSLMDSPTYAAAANNGLGQVMATKQDHNKAVEHFTQALELEPTATQIHYPLALSLRASGNTALAKQHLKLFSRRDLVIEDRLVEALQTLRNPASRHLVAAMSAVRKKEYDKAITEFKSGLEHEPNNTAARTSYARVLYLSGDKNEARSELAHIVADQPDNSLALFLLALLKDEAGDITAAVDLYQKVTELSPAHEGANFFLGNYFLKNQDFSQAIKHYDTVILANEKNTPAQVFKLVAMMAYGAPDSDILAVARNISHRAPNLLPIQRIQILLLALSEDTAVRNSQRGLQLAEQLYQTHQYPVNLELIALARASGGDSSTAVQQMSEAVAAETKHQRSQNIARMQHHLQLLQEDRLPKLDWREDIKHMLPPPTNALSTFRDYPDPNPI
jgi:tetratricopeptide (TPR) repeat protein